MSDYIKRKDVHDLVGWMERFRWRDPETGRGRDTLDYDQVQFGIDKLPTYDIPPVRIGRWEWLGPNRLIKDCLCGTCSVCEVRSKYIVNKEICPNCGAKMKI